jgi:hypothetical protein
MVINKGPKIVLDPIVQMKSCWYKEYKKIIEFISIFCTKEKKYKEKS